MGTGSDEGASFRADLPELAHGVLLDQTFEGGHGIGRRQEAAPLHPWVEPVRPWLPEGQNHQGKQ